MSTNNVRNNNFNRSGQFNRPTVNLVQLEAPSEIYNNDDFENFESNDFENHEPENGEVFEENFENNEEEGNFCVEASGKQ